MTSRNYSTSISAEKTSSEIEKILIEFGAEGILKEYFNRRISSLMFYISVGGKNIPFKLPLDLEKGRKIISKAVLEKKLPLRYKSEPLLSEQGERVVLRIIKDWLHSHLSLLEVDMLDLLQVFLPYVYDQNANKTLYQKFNDNRDDFIAISGDSK